MELNEQIRKQLQKFYFKPIPLWEMISPSLWLNMQENLVTQHFRKKEVVYAEGSYPKGIYIIRKGQVKVFLLNNDGSEQIIYFLGPDDMFGHRLIVSDEPSPVCISVLSDCVVDCIPKADVQRLLRSSNEVNAAFMYYLGYEFRVFVNKISYFGQKTAHERLTLALLVLHLSINDEAKTVHPLSFSRKDLASYVGIAPENLIRQLTALKNAGIINIKRKNIYLHDIDALIRMSNIL